MKYTYIGILLLVSLAILGCNEQQSIHKESMAEQQARVKANPILLKAHIDFLADDLLEGRDTGARGHEIASLYIATEFAKNGLLPGGNDNTFLQRVPFRQAFIEPESPVFTLSTPTNELSLSYPQDYLTFPSSVREQASVSGQLVFVGYGIVAPELEHNDYQDLDVEGKIVVALSGKPKSFPSEEGAHFGSSREKLRHASENGAIGFITISTPTAEKVRPYKNLLNFLHTPRVRWLDEQGQTAGEYRQIQNNAYFGVDGAGVLFAGASMSLEQIYAMLAEDKTPAGFALPSSVSFSKNSTYSTISSPNVVGILEGSDPALKHEYIVYSAHSDHIGFAAPGSHDPINNGAMDNASGTSVLIETARLLSQLPVAPKRSILFVAVTAEEKGLLGSDYFAKNPTIDGTIVANVNLDMPILTYEFADVIAFGANHSDLQASVAKAAEKVGLTLSPDPWPEQALFTRSDHYSFVKQGVPSVFLVPGLQSVDENIDGSVQFSKFIKSDYHKPGDDLSQPFNWRAASKFTEVNYHIGLTLANQDKRPSWNEGDFFGNTFAK